MVKIAVIRSIIIFLLTVTSLIGQEIPTKLVKDSLSMTSGDTIPLPSSQDTILKISISKDSLDTKVDYGARDSMRFDNVNSLIYLYGAAYVNYEGLTLTADYIEVNIDSSIARAQVGRDSSGNLIGIPEFQDGDQKFNAMRMKYNFKTRKGLVYEAVTKETDIYVRGTKTKYVAGNDSLGIDDMIFNKNAIFTTCDHPEPHYGIRSFKQKLVPNKLVVVGPSVVEIAGVPTPLVLPFAFFPLTKGKRSGLIFPRDYEYSEQWGFGIRGLGYYIPINDYLDTRIMGDIYFNGSWGLSTNTTYKKRYKYNGRVQLDYSIRKQEVFGDYREEATKSMRIAWTHSQNNKANPYHNFSGNIDFQINKFEQINENNAENALKNSIRSTVTYRRLFPDQPFSLTVALNHSQNNNTRDVSITFPDIKFNVRRIQPFKKKKKAIADKKWYEDIGLTYNLSAKNRYQTKDSLILQGIEAEKFDFGVKHAISTSANYNIFKYLLFNTSLKYDEYWHFRRLDQHLLDDTFEIIIDTVDTTPNGDPITEIDTLLHGILQRDTIMGFTPFRDFSVSTGFSTKLFGTKRFKKGKIRGIRHIISPSVSFRYSPNTQDPDLEYWKAFNTDLRPEENEIQFYSIFLNNAVGSPRPREQDLSINFKLDNNFEAKYFSKSDSTEKNLRLLDQISIVTDYNLARDSLKWNKIRMNTFTKLFKGFTRVSFAASFDPYAVRYDENGNERRINTSIWKDSRRLIRFERLDVRMSTIFSVRQIADFLSSKEVDQNDPSADPPAQRRPDQRFEPKKKTVAEAESLLDLFANFRINHTFNFGLQAQEGGDTLVINNHFIDINGSLQITPNWAIRLGRIGYNFKSEIITYPDLGFSRDLHCWELTFNWQPQRGTYSLFIGVKPGSMDFLKIPYRKNNIDTFF